MNEQRLQAYYQLIQNLLDCPSGEESEILAANQNLMDADMVQAMLQIASNLILQGELDQANRLMDIAANLLGVYGNSLSTAIQQQYLDFLQDVLQTTAESEGDAEVIYPLLAANTDKLDDICVELLRRWATNALAEVEADRAEDIAALMVIFSNLISYFPFGSKANNIEIAIAGYEIALTVYTRNVFPVDWARTQNNLGNAYLYRILGDRADNLEQAIAAFTHALEVYTRSAFPEDWATMQNNLGIAYFDRILGNRAGNLEQAIAAFTHALEVRTRNAFTQQWAMTQNNLGNAYSKRILGNRADNLEQAIAAFQAALEIRTRNVFPIDWAMTQNNLGNAYLYRILRNRADNIEQAIAAYTKALQVRTRSAFPLDWAMTQNNLGNAYSDRILGERADNLEQAIAAYTAALEVYTRSAFPQNHAEILLNLGRLYQEEKQFDLAYNTFAQAIATVETLRGEIVSGEEAKRKRYAPSCQLLRFTQNRARQIATSQINQFSDLFAIQNPTQDLAFTDIEVETIAADFQPQQILKHYQATKATLTATPTNENLSNSQWLHFSCHGYFNFRFPLKSALQLADAVTSNLPNTVNSLRYLEIDDKTAIDLDKCLTLEDIFQFNLNNCRLICLSACETGFIDPTNDSDEYIGLASGFISAGATNIISSLWAVSDFHTALLMIKFYENLPIYEYNVSLALNHTQQWLHQAKKSQIVDWIESKANMQNTQQQKIINFLQEYKPEQQPFKRPEFWAAFCAISPVYPSALN